MRWLRRPDWMLTVAGRDRRFAEQFEWASVNGRLAPPRSRRVLRRLSDSDLHSHLANPSVDQVTQIGLAREQRRREAWDAPAGRAYVISVLALIVAIFAAVISARAARLF